MRGGAGIAALCLALAGCSAGYYYDIQSGQRADANPDLLTKLERAKIVCRGEASKAVGASVGAFNSIFEGCMIGQGFEVLID